MSSEPFTEWGTLALAAARAGAAAIAEVVSGGALQTEHKSAGHDLVTAADKAAEAAVIAVIRAARPKDAILGEETGAQPGTTDVRWLVDPLDGTANFVYGRDDYAVSVGVEAVGRIIAGAVIRPADDRWAMADLQGVQTGRGVDDPSPADTTARLLNTDTPAGSALVAFGLPYSLAARGLVLGVISRIVPTIRGVRIMGSAAADLLAVAGGTVDAFIGFGLAEWDTAAGRALVHAAGGASSVITVQGIDVLVAGPRPLVEELSEIVRNAATGSTTIPPA